MLKFFDTLPDAIKEEFSEAKQSLPNEWGDSLIPKLFKLSEGLVLHYKSDLGHDCITVALAKPGDILLWSPRESGTYIVRTTIKEDMVEAYLSQYKDTEWFAILVLESGHACCGKIAKLGNPDQVRDFLNRIQK